MFSQPKNYPERERAGNIPDMPIFWNTCGKIHRSQCRLLDNLRVGIFRLHRIAWSTAYTISIDLLLVCSLANTTCAITNVMTAPIFIIVSLLHAFFLAVVLHSFLHVLVIVVVKQCFQHTPAVQSNAFILHLWISLCRILPLAQHCFRYRFLCIWLHW